MAYTLRTKDAALDNGRAADQNESVDNDIYFNASHLLIDNGYHLIEALAAGADTHNFTFDGIAGTWRCLEILAYLRSDQASTDDGINMQFNTDTGNNYDYLLDRVRHNNSRTTYEGIAQAYISCGRIAGATAPASAFDFARITIPAYSLAVNHKVARTETSEKSVASSTNLGFCTGAGWWRATAAITEVLIKPNNGTHWVSGSVAYLYGL